MNYNVTYRIRTFTEKILSYRETQNEAGELEPRNLSNDELRELVYCVL